MRKLLLVAWVILAACGAAPAAPAPPARAAGAATAPPAPLATASAPAPSAAPVAPAQQPPEAEKFAGVPLAIITQARRRLAPTAGVRPAELSVAGGEPRDWPDASLGCPDPAALYPAVPTSGFQLSLAAPDGTAYDLRSDASGAVMLLCRDGAPTLLDAQTLERQP